MNTSSYAPSVQPDDGLYKVTYMVNNTGVKLTRSFMSPFSARKFINKMKYSKHCTLISYPIFS